MTNYFSNIFHNISNLIMDCYDAHKNKWVDIILCDSHPHIGDVVYTKMNTVLDIGIIKSLNPLQIYARSTKYDRCGIPSQFGGVLYCTWYNSKINLSLSEWIKISKDSDVKTVCSGLNIPYYSYKRRLYD